MNNKVIRVSSKSNSSAVAGAIAGMLKENPKIEINAIGAGALNQAIKAVAIARGFVATSGVELVCIPSFGSTIIDGEEKTSVKLLLREEK